MEITRRLHVVESVYLMLMLLSCMIHRIGTISFEEKMKMIKFVCDIISHTDLSLIETNSIENSNHYHSQPPRISEN